MGRCPCSPIEGLHRGFWTKQEDTILSEYIRSHGDGGGWTNLPQKAGLKRSGKSCRLRWINYLRPNIRRGNISPDEEELIIRLHRLLGNRWSLIAGRLPGRTDNEIKNYWNTHLCKKLLSMKKSQSKSRTKNLKTTSKSCSPLPNHVFKTIAVKITTASTVRPICFNGYGCSDYRCSDEALKSCNVKESTERIAFAMADANLVEGGGRNTTCSKLSLEEEESGPQYIDDIAGDTATLHDNLFDLNELSFPQWNLLFSPSDCSADVGLEEFHGVAAAQMNEYEDILCYYRCNMQSVNSFTVSDNGGMEELYHNTEHLNWVHEVDYLQKYEHSL